jgi:hypothetical protein
MRIPLNFGDIEIQILIHQPMVRKYNENTTALYLYESEESRTNYA